MFKRIVLGCVVVLVVAVGALVVTARRATENLDAPYPQIARDESPEGLKRGAVIFHAMCESCHRGAGATTASGTQMKEAPEFLGTFYSANITSHPTAGAGALSDAQVARVIRFGVTHDGRKSVMGFAMGDRDIAAVLGFLRSDDPLFAPVATAQPKTALSVPGALVFFAMGLTEVPSRPAEGIAVPPRSDRMAYGRYLAHDLLDCAGCHTPGYDAKKDSGPEVFTGGFEFPDGAGNTVTSPSIRLSHGAKASWTAKDLGLALRDGLRPDGSPLRFPMIRVRGLEDDEVEALYTYLRSIGADGKPQPAVATASGAPGPRVVAGREHEAFVKLGCSACHQQGAPFHSNFVGARGKPAADIAAWIRRPQDKKPGTQMPTYESVLSVEDASLLAEWVVKGPVLHAALER